MRLFSGRLASLLLLAGCQRAADGATVPWTHLRTEAEVEARLREALPLPAERAALLHLAASERMECQPLEREVLCTAPAIGPGALVDSRWALHYAAEGERVTGLRVELWHTGP